MVDSIQEGAQRLRILIADDSRAMRELLSEAFGMLGSAVTCVKDGLEGLASLPADVRDLPITDYSMPRIDGIALFESLKESIPKVLDIAKESMPTLVDIAKDSIPELVDIAKQLPIA